ncbi:hypothetical protein [Pseudomonas sp. DrBHI1]|uniref:hypothetical protein n=1 Tax=Pseudomonas sp. DrBHI1 TaxID=2006091 RepID=UPI000B589038|nr:hypothetical protein [Pseudomonas sp. DrBHI1]OWQ36505.1 hypothetical protein CC207_08330 [Pseudomonas sp. DrBHI1]
MALTEDAKVAVQTVKGNPGLSRSSAVAAAIGLIALQIEAGKVDDLGKALDELSSLATKIQSAAT